MDWLQGRGVTATNGRALQAEVTAMTSYFQNGGHLLLSGTEVARAFAAGTSAQQSFLSNVLGVATNTGTGSGTVTPSPAQFLNGMSNLPLDNGNNGTYRPARRTRCRRAART